MNICLKTYAKQTQPTSLTVVLNERLPTWVQAPCKMDCTFQVKSVSDYYVLNLALKGTLSITCQRCLSVVEYPYTQSIELALCRTEEKADQLMSSLDCVVIAHEQANLEDLLTDELHLSTPEIPHELEACHLE